MSGQGFSRCGHTPDRVAHASSRPLQVVVTRGDERFAIDPRSFRTFAFRHGDELEVVPADRAASLPTTWGDIVVPVADGQSIRVPRRMEYFHCKGYELPVHLVELAGTDAAAFEDTGAGHLANFQRYMGIEPGMTVLDVGCGIGRDALQLIDLLDETGRYAGVDVTPDAVAWCTDTIAKEHPNFSFHHVDAFNELYNPFGTKTTTEIELPAESESVDRIIGVSLLTHLLEDEIVHYLHEFRRVLKPAGLAYVSLFLYSPEALASSSTTNATWQATFEHSYGGGFFGNDPVYPRGAVSFTDEALQRMLGRTGLRLVKPYLKGSWSGLHEQPDSGQDGAILGRAG